MSPAVTYPRPDFQRTGLSWFPLDGAWDFAFDDADAGRFQSWAQDGIPSPSKRLIEVPYAFQTAASGIGLHEDHEVIWYERTVTDIRSADEVARGNRLLVRFGAVDYDCSIWVNGESVGGHRGGHVPFDVDITDTLRSDQESARLVMRVQDSPSDLTQPRGKQYWAGIPQNIFYHPTSGIWQSVWLESVPSMRLCCGSGGTVLRSDDIERGELHARVAVTGRPASRAVRVEIEASLGGKHVSIQRVEVPKDREFASLDLDMKVADPGPLRTQTPLDMEDVWHNGVALWAPEHPTLYDLVLRLYDAEGHVVDEVQTTTGMRSLSWQTGDGTFRLNGKPYFQMLCLDQGYWPDTGMTPPSADALKADIEMAKRVGLNGCRKHQKVEDPVFLYWADQLGYLVWGEIADAYEFSNDFVERFNQEWMEAVKRDINHPCVVTWTPGNESWAYTSLKDNIEQRNHLRTVYYMTKTLDPSRPINDNCGWEHVLTDLTTFHDYADSGPLAETCSRMDGGILAAKGGRDLFVRPLYSGSTLLDPGTQHTPGAPVICSEFGGVNIAPPQKGAGSERDWGYTTAQDPTDYLIRLEKLVMAVVKGGHCCGFVYTQLCDVEQEVNGFYSYDRKEKVPAERVKSIMHAAQDYYYTHTLAQHSKGGTIPRVLRSWFHHKG